MDQCQECFVTARGTLASADTHRLRDSLEQRSKVSRKNRNGFISTEMRAWAGLHPDSTCREILDVIEEMNVATASAKNV